MKSFRAALGSAQHHTQTQSPRAPCRRRASSAIGKSSTKLLLARVSLSLDDVAVQVIEGLLGFGASRQEPGQCRGTLGPGCWRSRCAGNRRGACSGRGGRELASELVPDILIYFGLAASRTTPRSGLVGYFFSKSFARLCALVLFPVLLTA